MTELYYREVIINAGGLRIASRTASGSRKPNLRVSFAIERDLQSKPNNAELTIFNLSKDSRARLQEKGILTTIEAGYFGNTSIIFKGDLDYGSTTRQGSDWVTVMQATDGGKQYRKARINVSFDAGTQINDVLRTAAQAIGVGLGNLEDEIGKGNPRNVAQYVKGLVLSGNAAEQFKKIANRAGFGFSIQDNQIQLTRPGQVINPTEAIVLKNGTGLIGSPEKGENGIMNVTSLLQPELLPGKKVQIQSGKLATGQFEIDGFFRVEKVQMVGDTMAQEWYSRLEVKPL
jgi:hypothetical protein